MTIAETGTGLAEAVGVGAGAGAVVVAAAVGASIETVHGAPSTEHSQPKLLGATDVLELNSSCPLFCTGIIEGCLWIFFGVCLGIHRTSLVKGQTYPEFCDSTNSLIINRL